MANQFAKIPWQVALDPRLSLREIRVLIAILSFASDGKAFPKREQIAARCGMLTERVTKVTTSLVKKGWLTKTDGRGRKSSHYEVVIPDLDEIQKTTPKSPDSPSQKPNSKVVNLTTFRPETKGGQSDHVKGGQSDHLKGAQSDHLSFLIDQTTYQTSYQTTPPNPLMAKRNGMPRTDPKEPSADASGCVLRGVFEIFWNTYPRRCNKPEALKAWLKLDPSPDLADEIIRHIEDRKTRDDQWTRDNGRGIPFPATFLNNRRWEDEYITRPPSQDERLHQAAQRAAVMMDYEQILKRAKTNGSDVAHAREEFFQQMQDLGASRSDIQEAERHIWAAVEFGF